MMKNWRKLVIVVLGGTCGISAQSPNPLSAEVKWSYTSIKNNLIKMADKMPAEKYSFRPTPDVETFARRIAHITDANMNVCSGLNGERKPLGAASKTSKAELVAALKESFDYCDRVFNALTDVAAVEMVNSRLGGPFPPEPTRTRLATLYNLVRHSNEMYGYMAVYLRLNGVTPPTSAPGVGWLSPVTCLLRFLIHTRHGGALKDFQVHAVWILHEDGMGASAEVHDLSVGGDDIRTGGLQLADGGRLIVNLDAQRRRAWVANAQVELGARKAPELGELDRGVRARHHAGQLAELGPRGGAHQLQRRRILGVGGSSCQLNTEFAGVKRARRLGVFHGVREGNPMDVAVRSIGGWRFLDQLQKEAVGIAQNDGADFALGSGDLDGHAARGHDGSVGFLGIRHGCIDIADVEHQARGSGIGVLRLGGFAFQPLEMGKFKSHPAGQREHGKPQSNSRRVGKQRHSRVKGNPGRNSHLCRNALR